MIYWKEHFVDRPARPSEVFSVMSTMRAAGYSLAVYWSEEHEWTLLVGTRDPEEPDGPRIVTYTDAMGTGVVIPQGDLDYLYHMARNGAPDRDPS